jgi:hypothetical protein
MKKHILIAGLSACLALASCKGNNSSGDSDSSKKNNGTREAKGSDGAGMDTTQGAGKDTIPADKDLKTSPVDTQH